MPLVRSFAAIVPWAFERAALLELAHARRAQYAAAQPFPHLVIDGVLGPEITGAIARAFPDATHAHWRARDYPEQRRLTQLARSDALPGELRWLLSELCGATFLDFLGALADRKDLIADPRFLGAGPIATPRGGYLAVHTDFNRDSARHLQRAMTALYYAPVQWREEWGGHLELWDRQARRCETRIAPMPDRLVVFAHGEDHWHGQPTPVDCPPDMQRAVVAAYYYAAPPDPRADAAAHGARWQPR